MQWTLWLHPHIDMHTSISSIMLMHIHHSIITSQPIDTYIRYTKHMTSVEREAAVSFLLILFINLERETEKKQEKVPSFTVPKISVSACLPAFNLKPHILTISLYIHAAQLFHNCLSLHLSPPHLSLYISLVYISLPAFVSSFHFTH